MLSLNDILRVAKMDEACGPREHSFSPRWHDDRVRGRIPTPSTLPDVARKPQEEVTADLSKYIKMYQEKVDAMSEDQDT